MGKTSRGKIPHEIFQIPPTTTTRKNQILICLRGTALHRRWC